MNVYDSEKINDLLLFNGFKKTDDIEKTDVAILNTCHITKSQRKTLFRLWVDFLSLKKIRKIGKKFSIVVMGCVAQAEGGNC